MDKKYCGLSDEPYKKCVVCGTQNDKYREYCFYCECTLKTKTIGVSTSTQKLKPIVYD